MNNLCDSIDTLSMAYLDDELAAEELRDLELHLRDCAACRAHVDGEREAIAELRRRLAPPPAPDLMRRRLMAALDAEDAQTSRGQRTSWLLPGAASLAAVAALVLFFVNRANPPPGPKPAAPSIAEQVVKQQVRTPKFSRPAQRFAPGPGAGNSQLQMDVGVGGRQHAANEIRSIDRVATWDSELLGRDVVTHLFQVTTYGGGELAFQASVFDARGVNLTGGEGERVTTNGLDLRFGYTAGGEAMVIYESENGTGYVFSSNDLEPSVLVEIIASKDLVTVVAPR